MRTVDNLHDLQTLDTALAEERRRLEKVTLGLADRAAVDQSEQQLRDARQALKRIETDQRDQELATDSQRATVRDIERKLFGGKVVSPKELGNLSKEAEMLRKQISSKEDRLIELYDRLEAAHQAVTAAEATLAEAQRERAERVAALEVEQREIQTAVAHQESQRQHVRSQVEPRPLAQYDRLLLSRGTAVSELAQRTCQACRISLPLHEEARARAGPDLVQCSNCGRILWVRM